MKKKPEPTLRVRALQYLARREYGRAELRAKLVNYLQDEANATLTDQQALEDLLDDLTARGWLSDERAVAQMVHIKRNRFGLQRITHELRQKGIAENLIAEALPQLKETELETVREVWLKKFGNMPADAKEKSRQIRFLQSRGFAPEVIFKLLRILDTEEIGS